MLLLPNLRFPTLHPRCLMRAIHSIVIGSPSHGLGPYFRFLLLLKCPCGCDDCCETPKNPRVAIMCTPLLILTTLVFGSASLFAQRPAWQPAPGHLTLPLWPSGAPGAPPNPLPEVDTTTAKDNLIAGKPLIRLGNVSTPTLTLYTPRVNNTGAAVVVFPGGGYRILAIRWHHLRPGEIPRARLRALPEVFGCIAGCAARSGDCARACRRVAHRPAPNRGPRLFCRGSPCCCAQYSL